MRLQGEDRDEGDGDNQQREEERLADLLGRLDDDLGPIPRPPLVLPALQVLVGILDHDDGGIDHRPDGDGDPPQGHDVRRKSHIVHRDEGEEDGDREDQDRHQGTSEVEEEEDADQADNDDLFNQLLLQGGDCPLNEAGAVVHRDDLDAVRQCRLDLLDLRLDSVDHVQGVLTIAHDDDAPDGLALAVVVGDPSAHVGAKLDFRDIPQHDGSPLATGPERYVLEVSHRPNIPPPPDHVFRSRCLDGPAADVVVAATDRFDDPTEWDVIRQQGIRIDVHLVLLHEAPHAGHLGDPGHARQRVAEVPILEASKLREVIPSAPVDDGVLIHPPNPGGIGAQGRDDPLG